MTQIIQKYFYDTPIGKLGIAEKSGKIFQVSFFDIVEGELTETPLIKKAYEQLDEYFKGLRKNFDLPLLLDGSEFQIKVWKALMTIDYGKTATYGDIAKFIGSPKASRAVGGANNKNKIAIIIPCHRVIGSNGTLTGYAGGLGIKKYLLDLEHNA